jgi:hypothetical protein
MATFLLAVNCEQTAVRTNWKYGLTGRAGCVGLLRLDLHGVGYVVQSIGQVPQENFTGSPVLFRLFQGPRRALTLSHMDLSISSMGGQLACHGHNAAG